MSKKNQNKFALILLCLIVALTLSACGDKEDEEPHPSAQAGVNSSYLANAISDDDFLTTQGTKIINEKTRRQVRLNGTNFAGWLHLEGWMDGGGGGNKPNQGDASHDHNFYTDYDVRYALAERVHKGDFTAQQAEALLQSYQDNYIQRSDFEYVKSLGFNLIRIPFFWAEIMETEFVLNPYKGTESDCGHEYDYYLAPTGKIKETAFDDLDRAVEICRELGIYVLLDLHNGVGGSSGGWVTGGQPGANRFWTTPEYQQYTVDIWQAIAERYKDEATVFGYGLLNEPVMPSPHVELVTNEAYNMIYNGVREIDTRHIIVMGAFFSAEELGEPQNHWRHVVYETHPYDADNEHNAAAQLSFALNRANYMKDFSDRWNIPFMAGEFNFWGAETAWRVWLNTLNYYGFPWTNWAYKNTEQNTGRNWALQHKPDSEYPNYREDSYEEIERKWATFRTENFTRNDVLAAYMGDAARYFKPESTPVEIRKINAYRNGNMTARMTDDDPFTYWTSGENQLDNGKQFIEIVLTEKTRLNSLIIYSPAGNYAYNYNNQGEKHLAPYTNAQKFNVYTGHDDGAFKLIGSISGKQGETVIDFENVITDKIRITLTENANAPWGINELKVY